MSNSIMSIRKNNGAKALIKTLTNAGINTCFTNPGTSEMHFVAALDNSDMRAVLCLFEGVATGAADGYARIANKPAATLLHLGCGLGNGLANLHNARKARVPMVNIIGDHALYHKQYDAPLESDIETVARNVSSWIRTCPSTEQVGADAAEAIEVAHKAPQQISTLILPADVSWGEGGIAAEADLSPVTDIAAATLIKQISAVLLTRGKKTAILLGRRVLLEDGLIAASKISEKTGAKLFCEVFPTRLERGAGLPYVERIAYLAEMAAVQLRGYEHLIIIDTQEPVSFFAYPGKKSYLVPSKCSVHHLVGIEQDAVGSLQALVEAVGAGDVEPKCQPADRPALPSGKLNAAKVCQAVGALMPENAIISDEAQTSGLKLPIYTAGAPRHDVLTLTGGAIGQGLPVAIGAAIAGNDGEGTTAEKVHRSVIALVGDGSAMYTIQSLWTMMNENLDVTVVILNNRSYAILNIELERVGAQGAGPKAKSQLDLSKTPIDFVAMAKGMGMPAETVTTAEAFNDALARAIREPGPHLIDAIVPSEYEGLKLKFLPHVLSAIGKIPSPIAKALKKKLAP
ncbi:MAG: acetolactate synthase large subunit [Oleispira antarctica]|nr:acetolactate synthase large subunit [Oleispira antarctica]MBQ0791789.1 acetolactate synthase large subunit [Oleispira antarctica]